ncbi:MAG: hypothetical protein JWN65_1571 [Solirubrobacterales bacterium]|nr:hypothetical protein [Solirubrobacterales bacterium]
MRSATMPALRGPLRFARMAGSSIAAPGAIAWFTDFVNAAYYARADAERDIRDLRLAHGIMNTRWSRHRHGGRLGALDVVALHRAYGGLRLRRRGRLDHDALLSGARTLLGDWFPAAWEDDARRAHGIAFRTTRERDGFAPERRMRHAALRPLTPPRCGPADQHWNTYDAVALLDAEAALACLTQPARWPDFGAATGRFTALRTGGLKGQTFEIEAVAEPTSRSPIFTRGYVTCTTLHVRGGHAEAGLGAAVADLGERFAAGAGAEAAPPLVPEDADPLALVVLTTHEGHFLGRGASHLLAWRDPRGAWIRNVGAWDPLPLHLAAAYAAAGREAQRDFWSPGPPDRSMLVQLSVVSAGRG